MDKKLLNEIERIKSLISEETLYGNQIDNPPLLTEDWKSIIKKNLMSNYGEVGEAAKGAIKQIDDLVKNKTIGTITTKINGVDFDFANYVKEGDFINDLDKFNDVWDDVNIAKKIGSLGLGTDYLKKFKEANTLTHNENIKMLKEINKEGKKIPADILKDYGFDESFIKKYDLTIDKVLKKSGYLSKNVNTLIENQPALKKDLQFVKNMTFQSKIFNKLKGWYAWKGVKPYDAWKTHMVGADWKIKSPIKSLNKNSVYGQFFNSLPSNGRKASWFNFNNTNPSLSKSLGKFIFSGYATYGPSYYTWYATLSIIRYAAESTYCKNFKKNIDSSTVVPESIEIDNIFTKLINEQESKSHFEKGIDIDWDVVLEYLNYFKHVLLTATGLPLMGFETSYDPGSLVNMPLFTTEICTLDEDIVKSHDEHKRMLEIIKKYKLCIPTQKWLNIDEDKKPTLLKEGEHFICGDEIEKDLEAWNTKTKNELKDIFSGIKMSDLTEAKKKMVEVEENLNKIILYDKNGNTVTWKDNKDKWKNLFMEAVKDNPVLSNIISSIK